MRNPIPRLPSRNSRRRWRGDGSKRKRRDCYSHLPSSIKSIGAIRAFQRRRRLPWLNNPSGQTVRPLHSLRRRLPARTQRRRDCGRLAARIINQTAGLRLVFFRQSSPYARGSRCGPGELSAEYDLFIKSDRTQDQLFLQNLAEKRAHL